MIDANAKKVGQTRKETFFLTFCVSFYLFEKMFLFAPTGE